MNFTVSYDSVCAAGGHYNFTVSDASGSQTIVLTKDDLNFEPDSTNSDLKDKIVQRIRTFIKENNLLTPIALSLTFKTKSFSL